MRPRNVKRKIIFQYNHVCKLNKELFDDELPSYPPYAPNYIKLLYSIGTEWSTVYRYDPRVKEYFRSRRTLLAEKRRQLENIQYRIIIHPFSKIAMLKRLYCSILWIVAFIVEPLFGSFMSGFIEEQTGTTHENLLLVLNFFLTLNIIMNFFLGYTIANTKEIVLDQNRIVRHYLRTFFVFDLIPVIYQFLYLILKLHSLHYDLLIIPLYYLRCVRLETLLRHFNFLFSYFNINQSIAICTSILVVQLFLIHWFTCIFHLIPSINYYLRRPTDNSWVVKVAVGSDRSLRNIYIDCLLGIACHYFGAAKGNIDTDNPVEQVMLSLVLMCGLTVQIYVVGLILHLFGAISISETKYEEIVHNLNEYMVTKKLPPKMRQRLHMYYENRYQKQFFNESVILASLSEHLRCEVHLYNCQNLIEKMKLLHGASKNLIGAIVMLLKQEIYLPEDQIIQAESYNENIYFISYGTVAVTLPNGMEGAHMEDGQHFGEMHIVMQNQGDECAVTVTAVEVTEVFYLDKKDFVYILNTYPEMADLLERSARNKIFELLMIMQQKGETVDSSDILTELRKGHILDKPKKRR